MKFVGIFCFVFLLVIGMSFAEEITSYPNVPTSIVTACIRNGQLISNATANITIYDDLGSKLVDNVVMSSNVDGKFYYNYNFNSLGWYSTKETCKFDNFLSDGSTKIHIIETTLFQNIINDLNNVMQMQTNHSYQLQQINNSINSLNISGGGSVVNNNFTDLNNSITGLIIAQNNAPPIIDLGSLIIIFLMVLLIITIWVRNAPYFFVVGFSYILGGVFVGVDKSVFVGLVIGLVGIMYLIGAGLKGNS